jgi:hypothetical protein
VLVEELLRQRVMMETTVLEFFGMMATCCLIGEDTPSPNRTLILQSQSELKEVVLQLYSGAITTEAFLETAPFPYSVEHSSANMYWLFLDTVMDALARAISIRHPGFNPNGLRELPDYGAGSKLHTFCGELWCRHMQLCVGVWRIAYSSSKFSLPHYNFSMPEDLAPPLVSVPMVGLPTPGVTGVAFNPEAAPVPATPPSTAKRLSREQAAAAAAQAESGFVSIPVEWEEIVSIGDALEIERLKQSFALIQLRLESLQRPHL